jgi:hypothetical protein
MSAPGGTLDEARLAALSARLGISARQLLIAAARLAESDTGRAVDPAFIERVLCDARQAGAAAESSARLLLTPIADYAINEIEVLFAGIWPEPAERPER